MRIGEIAEKTGLSISNIRFYEKKRLIGPKRDTDSKYRNYTEEDLNQVKQIILYRKMDFSVEMIRSILENQVSMEDILEQQLIDLRVKQQMIQSSIDLCQRMIDDRAYTEIDVNYYNNYVKEEEAKGKIFSNIDDFLEDFSCFTRYNEVIGFQLFSYPWINRIARIAWCAFFILAPILFIVDSLIKKNEFSVSKMVFWLMWMFCYIFCFLYFYRHKEKKKEL